MRRLEIDSPAKVNWFLHVGPQRSDGFHELETVFQEIDLVDRITIEAAAATTLECSDPSVPQDERNLAWRAWALAHQRWQVPPVRIVIQKVIPAGGGLAGGSSNAASVLIALLRLAEIDPAPAEVADLALELGSDVPFFLLGGVAYARGRGEILDRLDAAPEWPLLLIFPGVPVSTPDTFRRLAALRREMNLPAGEFCGKEAAARALGALNPRELNHLRNDLERPAFDLAPEVAAAARAAMLAGAPMIRMSGSGSTVFAAFESEADRDRARVALEENYRVVAARPVRRT